MKDEFEELIDTAFVLNGDYSIYEVMDLDRPGPPSNGWWRCIRPARSEKD